MLLQRASRSLPSAPARGYERPRPRHAALPATEKSCLGTDRHQSSWISGCVCDWAASLTSCGLLMATLVAGAHLSLATAPALAMTHEAAHHTTSSTPHHARPVGMDMSGAGATVMPIAPGCQPMSLVDRPSAYDSGGYTHPSSTQIFTAQELIDQGLLLAYNYNQLEARASFQAALAVDPTAAMAYWGLAYAQGPFMNKVAAPPPADMTYPVFTQQELEAGRQAVDAGLTLVDQQLLEAKVARALGREEGNRITALERDKAYLQALAPIFQHDLPYGPGWLRANNGFAQTMEVLADERPDDADALAFAAEAWANTQPWDFWEVGDPSQPKGYTEHILDLLSRALAINPNHPLAGHLLIHVTEGSTATIAGTATAAADMLGSRYNTLAHLVHMPSHTYLKVGRWHDAVIANQRALELDLQHARACLEPEMPSHDAAMGIYAAMTAAEQGVAQEMAAALANYPATFGPTYMSEGRDRLFYPLVHLRFGSWGVLDRITPQDLDQSQDGVMLPGGSLEFNQAMYHYFDVMRLAARATSEPNVPQWTARARQALVRLSSAVSLLPEDAVTLPGTGLGVYSLAWKLVAEHAEQVAGARLAVLAGQYGEAARLLSSAVVAESSTGYTEPPRFSQPQGECLGWVLLKEGKISEAATAYMKVLAEYPRSPWALTGLRDVHLALDARTGPPPFLPAGMPSKASVEGQLKELQAESKGQAVELPSSCPAFSVKSTGPLRNVPRNQNMGLTA